MRRFDPYLRSDLLKVLFAALSVLALVTIFIGTPGLSTPTFIALIASLLLSPPVTALERRGYRRSASIAMIFSALAAGVFLVGARLLQLATQEWDSIRLKAPEYFSMTVQRVRELEAGASRKFGPLSKLDIAGKIVEWGDQTGTWFMGHAPSIAGDLLIVLIISPILTFFILNDGPYLRKRFFQLVPNRFFESTYSVITDISNSITDYIRAKLIEAMLIGVMTTLGLWAVGAPYSIALGFFAGATNIIPYAGPFIGLIPAVIVVSFDPSLAGLMLPVLLVYLTANLIDNIYVFPVVVAKLVNLHPLILIAVVTLGQHYSGLIGMLISIPIASAMKVVILQVHRAIYDNRTMRRADTSRRAA